MTFGLLYNNGMTAFLRVFFFNLFLFGVLPERFHNVRGHFVAEAAPLQK